MRVSEIRVKQIRVNQGLGVVLLFIIERPVPANLVKTMSTQAIFRSRRHKFTTYVVAGCKHIYD